VFTVRLPRLAAPAPVRPAEIRPTAPRARRRVLLAEDNDDAREMLRVMLELLGHEVFQSADGSSGVDLTATVVPDVALIDVGLPGLDGYEVARRIRSGPVGASVLLVALTGYGQTEDRQRALDAGFDAHVTKPVSPEQLSEILASPGRRR
jgi:CheY-like chemotaxis protein